MPRIWKDHLEGEWFMNMNSKASGPCIHDRKRLCSAETNEADQTLMMLFPYASNP
jgi:hypothetical protein